MKTVTPKQIAKTVNLIAQSRIDSAQYQALLKSGRFTALLQEFADQPAQPEPTTPEPTITPIKVPMDYTRTLVQMRDAANCDGQVNDNLNDKKCPVRPCVSAEREFVLVCFNRDIDDNADPAKSELLWELDKLGLQPEGPAELCAVGEHDLELHREFPIVARRQVWRDADGNLICPALRENIHERHLILVDVDYSWDGNCRFLASRKAASSSPTLYLLRPWSVTRPPESGS